MVLSFYQERGNCNCKRIESGRYVMISSLLKANYSKKIFEWEEKLINNEMLVRDIIDLDTNFIDDEKLAKSIKEKSKKEAKEKILILIQKLMIRK